MLPAPPESARGISTAASARPICSGCWQVGARAKAAPAIATATAPSAPLAFSPSSATGSRVRREGIKASVASRRVPASGPRSQAGHTWPQAARQGLQAPILGQDSACQRRFRSEATDWNLGFPRGGVTLVLGKPGGGARRRSQGEYRLKGASMHALHLVGTSGRFRAVLLVVLAIVFCLAPDAQSGWLNDPPPKKGGYLRKGGEEPKRGPHNYQQQHERYTKACEDYFRELPGRFKKLDDTLKELDDPYNELTKIFGEQGVLGKVQDGIRDQQNALVAEAAKKARFCHDCCGYTDEGWAKARFKDSPDLTDEEFGEEQRKIEEDIKEREEDNVAPTEEAAALQAKAAASEPPPGAAEAPEAPAAEEPAAKPAEAESAAGEVAESERSETEPAAAGKAAKKPRKSRAKAD